MADEEKTETPVETKEEAPKLSDLSGHKKEEMLASLAVLVLADGEKDITVDNVNALLEKSGNSKGGYFASAFVELVKGRKAMDMVNLSGGGGGGGAASGSGSGDAAEEEKKEEEEEEEEEEVAMGNLMGGGDDDGW
jgi:ribosomal protein L12E/L44/L45/RPP1/RPP2